MSCARESGNEPTRLALVRTMDRIRPFHTRRHARPDGAFRGPLISSSYQQDGQARRGNGFASFPPIVGKHRGWKTMADGWCRGEPGMGKIYARFRVRALILLSSGRRCAFGVRRASLHHPDRAAWGDGYRQWRGNRSITRLEELRLLRRPEDHPDSRRLSNENPHPADQCPLVGQLPHGILHRERDSDLDARRA